VFFTNSGSESADTAVDAVEPLLPMAPEQAKAGMAEFQKLTAAMLVERDYQQIPSGRFVKRSGWQKITTGYSISCTILVEEVLARDENGEPTRARAIVRATDRHGRHQDGSGRCSITESRFRRPEGKGKVEHDVTSTAVTRAQNRAVSNLVGYGQVSAEEMDSDGAPAPLYGPEAGEQGDREAAAVIQRMHPEIDGYWLVKLFKTTLGVEHIPEAGLRALKALQWALDHPSESSGNARQDAAASAPEGRTPNTPDTKGSSDE